LKKIVLLSVLLLSCAALLPAGIAVAEKKPPPKPKPTDFLVITMENVIITSTNQDGSTETFELDGRLHLATRVTLNAEGDATEFRLHANLMDAFGTSQLDGERVPANGGVELTFAPTDPCIPGACELPVWNVTFPDVVKTPSSPPGLPIPYPNLNFSLRIATTFDTEGGLTDATLVTDIID
jgi:hypothetical protein